MVDAGPAVSRRTMLQGAVGALALAGVPGLAACGSSKSAAKPASGSDGPAPMTIGAAREAVAISAVPDLGQVVAGMTAFSGRLHRESAPMTANWTISPLSIEVAFAMLRAGASGSTAGELDQVFGFPKVSAPAGSPHAALNALTAKLTTNQPGATKAAPSSAPHSQGPPPVVAIANGLFLDRAFAPRVQHAFLTLLASQYGAAPRTVDFTSPGAVAQLNLWVVAQTHGRITRLFDHLDPSVKLVLANAVYLKANWARPFQTARTTKSPFTTSSGQPVRCQLMRQTFDGLAYSATADWQRVSLPYLSSDLTMRVVVPTTTKISPAIMAGALTAATASTAKDRFEHVDLRLPRWNTATKLDLPAALRALGMSDVFDAHADFTGIAPGLFVSDAIHRANITVDEKGTEAAAVTGIGVATLAMTGAPIVVAADRPFAWAIVHQPTGTPLFTGHVVNPLI